METGRKTKLLQIGADGGRDRGKCFVLKEMSAYAAEKWAYRVLLALANGGGYRGVPPEAVGAGWAGLALVSMQALMGVRWPDAEPLLAEMMACVRIQPSPTNPEVVRDLVDGGTDGDDIQEVATRVLLRKEVFLLHASFFMDAGLSGLMAQLGLPVLTRA